MSKHARTNQLRNHTLRWRCASSALRLAIAAATSLGLTAGAVALWSAAPANAAETHQNCVVTDDQGNILSVTPNCSETSTYQGGQSSDPNSVNPCTGDTGTFTMYFRQNTFHVNVDGAGDLWATGTESGTVSFGPRRSLGPRRHRLVRNLVQLQRQQQQRQHYVYLRCRGAPQQWPYRG